MSRRHHRDDVISIVVRYIGTTNVIYALAVALCALLSVVVPESLTALAGGAAGYLAGLLTPRPGHEPIPVTNAPGESLDVTPSP